MPITQDKMIDVIMAGLNFMQAYQTLRTRLETFDRDHCKSLKEAGAENALAQWSIFYSASMDLLPSAVHDEVLLLTEHQHYRKFYNNNVLHKKQMERKRAAKRTGIPLADIRRDPIANLTQAEMAAREEELRQLLKDAPPPPTTEEESGYKLDKIDIAIDVAGTPFESNKTK